MLIPLDIPPGVDLNQTEYQAGKPQLRWRVVDKCRWYGRQLGPIGGWRTRSADPVTGVPRAILPWRAGAATRYIAIGTEQTLYVQDVAGVSHDVTPSAFVAGNVDEAANTGFGAGPFGADAFGTARKDTGTTISALVWDLDVFGSILVGCAFSDGRVFEWDGDLGTPAAAVTNAPTDCAGCFVTEQGFLVAYGAGGDPRLVAWSDQNGRTDWTPSTTNQAGSVEIATSGTAIKGMRLGAVSLLVTDVDAHMLAYVGLPSVYSFQRVGHGCGAISKGCIVPIDTRAAWWSKSGFWLFNGGVVAALDCPVWDYLQKNANLNQKSKITGWHNAERGEVWWHYPSSGSQENDSYVFFAYRQSDTLQVPVWGYGTLARTAAVEPGVFAYPMALDAGGFIYEHEVGLDYGGAIPRAETGAFELGSGDKVMDGLGFISDDKMAGDVTLSIKGRMLPDADEATFGPFLVTSAARTDCRWSARQARLVVEGIAQGDEGAERPGDAGDGQGWRFGMVRVDVQAAGGR